MAGLACGVIALALAVFGEAWRGTLGDVVRQAYYAAPDSNLGRAFAWLASSRAVLPEDFYLARVYLAYRWANTLIGLGALALGGVYLALRFPARAERLRRWLTDMLAPMPSLPRFSLPVAPITKAVSVVLLPGIFLGMLTAVRVLGPWAGALVVLAFMLQPHRRSWLPIGFYLGVAGLTALVCWPYLWPEPAARFADVLRHMADNPKLLPVLFAGTVYASNELPTGYLPRLLALTLTEPVWPLAVAGLVISGVRVIRRQIDWRTWTPIVLWLALPYGYVVTQRPAMYDGYRHFLFILPPVFIGCGLAFDALWSRLRNLGGRVILGALVLVPGLLGIVSLHPYPYTYYNLIAGGVRGAFRSYETDYWLTCYKETLEAPELQDFDSAMLYVHRQPTIARVYAGPRWRIEAFDPDADQTTPRSLLLLTTRTNSDLAIHPTDPVILNVGRQGATFCVVKRIPDR